MLFFQGFQRYVKHLNYFKKQMGSITRKIIATRKFWSIRNLWAHGRRFISVERATKEKGMNL